MIRSLNFHNHPDKENLSYNSQQYHILPNSKKHSIPLLKKVSDQPTKCSSKIQVQDYQLGLKRHYSQKIADQYADDIFTHISTKNLDTTQCLKLHNITSNLRSRMVDWMIEVLSSYKMSEQSFFKSVYLMDGYLKKQGSVQSNKQIHLIGLTCMFMATKYEQIYPLQVRVLSDKIARSKFHRQQIINKQSRIIEAFNFDLEFPTVFQILKFIYHEIKLDISKTSDYFFKILIYLSKMCMINQELAATDNLLLASSVYFIGLKTLQQVEKTICPEQTLVEVSRLVQIPEVTILNTSRQVLQLAKNFGSLYPQYTNLKKFNRFGFPKN